LFTQQNFKLLIKRHPLVESGMQREYMFKSRNTLNLPEGSTDYHYMSWPVIWYKDIVLELQNYLNKCYKQNWQKSLYDAVTISEYCLYGIFVEEILKPNDLKIIDEKIYFGIWDQDDFMKFISNDFTDIKNEVCVVIQSNLGMSVHEYKKQVDQFLEKK
ncbi:MAG: DUF6492 family protein, partial [Draconibacterium sp.]|nr:DUF6492 family protein [Draconibacterium sp.]